VPDTGTTLPDTVPTEPRHQTQAESPPDRTRRRRARLSTGPPSCRHHGRRAHPTTEKQAGHPGGGTRWDHHDHEARPADAATGTLTVTPGVRGAFSSAGGAAGRASCVWVVPPGVPPPGNRLLLRGRCARRRGCRARRCPSTVVLDVVASVGGDSACVVVVAGLGGDGVGQRRARVGPVVRFRAVSFPCRSRRRRCRQRGVTARLWSAEHRSGRSTYPPDHARQPVVQVA